MKTYLFFLGLLIHCVCISFALDAKYVARLMSTVQKCQEETGVDQKTIMAYVKGLKIPSVKEEKCMFGCIMRQYGYFKDDKVNLSLMKEHNIKKYETEPTISKVQVIYDNCYKRNVPLLKDQCQFAYDFYTCTSAEMKKNKIVLPISMR